MINLDRLEEIEKIAQEALDLSSSARAAFIVSACHNDPELQTAVVAIVEASSTPTASFETASSIGLSSREEIKLKRGDTVAHFVIREPLDEGGMGAVYVAHDTVNDRDVALKILSTRLSRVSRDKLGARFASPYIVALYESGETAAGLTYIAMERVDGVPITTFSESLPLKARLILFREVCAGVAVIHAEPMIHRDLKPDNILVTKEGIPKILDFGTARLLSAEPSLTLDPQPNDRFLSPEFASPEQLARTGLSAATDIYSLGVLFCLLLAGRLPYRVKTRAVLSWAITNLEPERPSALALANAHGESYPSDLPRCSPPPVRPELLAKRLSGDLDVIAIKCLQKEQKDRYLSVQDLSKDISNYFESRPVSARRPTVRNALRKAVRRNALSIAVIFGLLAFIAVLVSQVREARYQRDNAHQAALQAKESKSMLLKALAFYDPEIKISDLTIGEFLDRTASEIPFTMRSQPSGQVELLTTLAQVYIDRDMHSRAEQVLQTALSLCRKGLAPAYPSEADTLTWLGDLRREEGKLIEAEAFLRRSIKIRQAHTLADDPDLLFTLLDLGQVEEAQFRRKEAEELYRKVLALRLRAPHPDRVAIAQSLNALGALLSSEHRDAEAENLLRRSLAIREAAFGHDHPLVANTMENLGEALAFEKKTNEAETLYRSALLIYRKLFGARNHRTITATTNLGSFLVVAGRPDEGVGYLREAVTYAKEVHHPLVIELEVLLARALALTVQFDEADKALDDAYAAVSHTAGTPLMLRATVIRTQGQVALKRGDFATAETKLKTAAAMFLESGNKATDHVVVATRSELGEALVKRGRFAEAEPLLLAFLKVASPIETTKALERVIDLYHAWGKSEKAAAYRSQLDELDRTAHRQEKGSTASQSPR